MIVLAVIVMSGATTAATEKVHESGRADTVLLTFAWRPGMTAKVVTKAGRLRNHFSPNPKGHEVEFESSLEVSQSGVNLRLSSSGLRVKGEALVPSKAAQSIVQLAGLYPNHTVTSSGDFLAVTDPRETASQLVSSFEAALSGDEHTALRRHLESRLASQGMLESLMSKWWDSAINTWIGETMVLGAEYGGESVVPHPAIPNSAVRLDATFSVTRTDSCTRRSVIPGCVQLYLSYIYNSDDLIQAAVELGKKLGDQAEVSKISGIRIDVVSEEYTIVVDPLTLIPYSAKYVKTIEGERAGKREGRREYSESTYTYE